VPVRANTLRMSIIRSHESEESSISEASRLGGKLRTVEFPWKRYALFGEKARRPEITSDSDGVDDSCVAQNRGRSDACGGLRTAQTSRGSEPQGESEAKGNENENICKGISFGGKILGGSRSEGA